VRPEGLGKLKIFNDPIGSLTRDHPVSSIVPRPIRERNYNGNATYI
jgi:hypothetical protein